MVDNTIRFVLDGKVHSVSGIDPNTTVLNYLREQLRRCGTKEGCAEGDCGACTVVAGELAGNRVRFRAINSCIQFLPTLNGKALFTVESLKAMSGQLHPVQAAMLNAHGSQCGFCTPGFVMSLFAMYRTETRASRSRIKDVLAGNLCRCTGYRPIIDAAQKMYDPDNTSDEHWLRRPYDAESGVSADESALVEQLKSIQPKTTLTVTAPGPSGDAHVFFAPVNADELAALVRRYPDARLLAGGTDVGLWVTKDHQDIGQIIYLGNVEELKTVVKSEASLDIGAGVSLTDLEDLLAELQPDFGELLRRFASPPIRNAATLGGNIANGSPIGDSMPALIALGSSVVLRKGSSRRELALEDLYLGYRKTALARGEFVERIRIPVNQDQLFRAYKVSKRFDQDISAVLGAFCIAIENNKLTQVRICFGGMAATPKRATHCEEFLRGKAWDESVVAEAASKLEQDFAPIDDMRASAGYRKNLAGNLLRKFYLETSGFTGATRVLTHLAEG